MKPIEQPTHRIFDLVRNVIYSTVPIMAVIVVWAFAYANSLESKLQRDLGPLDDRPNVVNFLTRRAAGARTKVQPASGVRVSSIDEND